MDRVQAKHPGLELVLDANGRLHVRGVVGFTVEHDDRTVSDAYEIDLRVPPDFPDSPPIAFETAGKIQEEFEHFMDDGSLCLGASAEIRWKFAKHQDLLQFIDEQVVPYLFSHSYNREFREMPFGERAHGYLAGALLFYAEFFDTFPLVAMQLLKTLADNTAPSMMRCPCNSGKRLGDCHAPKLEELRPLLPADHFAQELKSMIAEARALKIPLPTRRVIPRRMWRQKERQWRKRLRKDTKRRASRSVPETCSPQLGPVEMRDWGSYGGSVCARVDSAKSRSSGFCGMWSRQES